MVPTVPKAPRDGESRATRPPWGMKTDWIGVPLPPASPMSPSWDCRGTWRGSGSALEPQPLRASGRVVGSGPGPATPVQTPRAPVGLSRLLRLAKGACGTQRTLEAQPGSRLTPHPVPCVGCLLAPTATALPALKGSLGLRGRGPEASASVARVWRSEELIMEAAFVFKNRCASLVKTSIRQCPAKGVWLSRCVSPPGRLWIREHRAAEPDPR